MNNVTKIGLLVLAVFLAHASNAATWHTGYVRTLYPLANGNFVITFMEPVPACTNAPSSPYLYAIVGSNGLTQDGLKNIYSAALAAAGMGKRLSVNFDETRTDCRINRAYIRVGVE